MLEKTLKEFDDEFNYIFDTIGKYPDMQRKNVKNFLIQSHINFCEENIKRLKESVLELEPKGTISEQGIVASYGNALFDEINHYQQEIIKAKKLIK